MNLLRRPRNSLTFVSVFATLLLMRSAGSVHADDPAEVSTGLPSPGSLAPRPGPQGIARAGPDDPDGFRDRFARSYMAGRAGQVMFVTEPGYFLTFPRIRYNHGSAWDYDARVPLVFYGPEQIRPGTHRGTGAQSYDVAATLAEVIGQPPPPGSRGRAWREVFAPDRGPVKALLLVVMDQVGMQDVERFAEHMPTLSRWRREGADFPDVRLHYLPTMTAVSHASIGVGAPPAIHGIVSNMIPDASGRLRVVFRTGGGRVSPETSKAPTLADWIDSRLDNQAQIVTQIYAEYAATAVSGHGAGNPGADKDVVVWLGKDGRPTTDPRYFRLPQYIASRDIRPISKSHHQRYQGLEVPGISGAKRAGWYARWEAESALQMIREEGIGTDDVPDLVVVNLKSTDAFGHSHGHDHPGYAGTLAEVDRFLREAEVLLGKQAGPSGFVAAVTADHGLVPDDGARLLHRDYKAWLNEVLDGDGDGKGPVTGFFGGHVYLDEAEAAQDKATPERVAQVLKSDPAVRHTWTEAEIRARHALIDLDRSEAPYPAPRDPALAESP